MKVNGFLEKKRVMGFKYGPTIQNMKGIGKTTKPMEKDKWFMQMVIYILVIFLKINNKDMENISETMVRAIKGSGIMIIWMEEVLKPGLMELDLRESL
jgi:hypothetical protein